MKTQYRVLCLLLFVAVAAGSLKEPKAPDSPITGGKTKTILPRLFKINKTAKPTAGPVSENVVAMIQQDIAKREYHISLDQKKGILQSPNRKQNVRAYYKPGELTIKNRIDAAGHNFKLKLINEGIYADGKKLFTPQTDAISENNENTLRIKHKGFTEEYINNEQGVRQNFIINSAPGGTKNLEVRLSAAGLKVKSVGTNKLQFESKTGERVTYSDLKCWDANGKSLEASLAYEGGKIGIEVNVSGAVFPVTVDPILANENSSDADKILYGPTAGQDFAYSVSSAGDVNGDGYSDVLVGAPFYDGDFTNEGAVFLYFGSSIGINTLSQTLTSKQANSLFGICLSPAGDVNGDGFGDVIIGAPYYYNGQQTEGAAAIYYGSSTGLIPPDELLLGDHTHAFFGNSVATAGDINGDGFSDVLVGAPGYSQGNVAGLGACFIFHGSATGITKAPAQILKPTGNVNLESAEFGSSVASAGDINGDGYSDIIIGAPGYDGSRGAAFVYGGSNAGIEIAVLQRYEGLNGSDVPDPNIGDRFGSSVSSAGDLNGDGFSDIIIGSPNTVNDGNFSVPTGRALVYNGSADGTGLNPSIILKAPTENHFFGGFATTVGCAGDVNGDGFSDVIIGNPFYDGPDGNIPLGGGVFIYNGSSNGLKSNPTSKIVGSNQSMNFGLSSACAGDVNGDGYSDIIAGTRSYAINNQYYGAAFIFHGSASRIENSLAGGSPGGQASAFLGLSITAAGDLNGDGFSDVAVGSPNYDKGEDDEGIVRVYYGSINGIDFALYSDLESNNKNANLGSSVSSAGDTNGDGYDDLIAGAPNYTNGQSSEGAVYLYLGTQSGISNSPFIVLEGDETGALFGTSIGAGDLNADGYSDIIVGAPNSGNGAGSVFVYLGKAGGIIASAKKLIVGNVPGINFIGRKVAGIGDINGDGFSDVALTLDFDGGQSGTISIFHGSAAGLEASPSVNLQTNGILCQSFAGAGDINGDGFSDFIAGIPGYSANGGVFIYYGSASGLPENASLKFSGNVASSGFGSVVSAAGDINGDGYSDVICADPNVSNGQSAEGGVYIYTGSPNGLSLQNPVLLELDQSFARFGTDASTAGDINGDGYSDIVAGAPYYDSQFLSEGALVTYHGNNGGLRNNLRVYNANLSSSINHTNVNEKNFGIGLFEKSFIGRNKGKLVWETRKEGEGFSHNSPITNSTQFTGQQGAFTDLGSGLELKALVEKIGAATKVRARVKYDPALAITGQVYSPWRYLSVYSSGGSFYQATPLPVTLVNFTAEKSEKNVLLEWVTSNEENSESFEVQRSRDGKTWKKLGSVSAQNNSSQEWHYQFTDSSAAPGTNFYRLKMIDQDQTYTFSRVRSVSMGGITENMINLFPNPTVDKLSLSANGREILGVRIINVAGSEVMRVAHPEAEIDVKQLKPGVYVVVLQLAEGNTVSKSIVKK